MVDADRHRLIQDGLLDEGLSFGDDEALRQPRLTGVANFRALREIFPLPVPLAIEVGDELDVIFPRDGRVLGDPRGIDQSIGHTRAFSPSAYALACRTG